MTENKMGKGKHIYFSDENLVRIDKLENQSELINNLLDDYFKEDVATLKDSKKTLTEQIASIDIKIKKKKELLTIRKEARVTENRNYELARKKEYNDRMKQADSLVFTYDVPTMFTKMVFKLLKNKGFKINKIEYTTPQRLLDKIIELYGTVENPTELFQKFTANDRDYINRIGDFPV